MRLGIGGILIRAWYYRTVLGTAQGVELYVARALRRRRLMLRVPGVPRQVLCRPAEPDRITLCHVFYEKDADVLAPLDPRVIIDVGANVGYASVYYANRFPNATIIALEPDAANFAIARENCAPYPQIHLLQAALWARNAPVTVFDPGLGTWSSWGLQVREAAQRDLHRSRGTVDPGAPRADRARSDRHLEARHRR